MDWERYALDQGKLLYESDVVRTEAGTGATVDPTLWRPRHTLYGLLVIGAIVLIVALFGDSSDWPYAAVCTGTLLVLIITFAFIGRVAQQPFRERVFENGFTEKDTWAGGEIFVPWSKVKAYDDHADERLRMRMDELEDIKGMIQRGEVDEAEASGYIEQGWDPDSGGVTLYGNGVCEHTILGKVDNFDAILQHARDRVGRPEYDVEEWDRYMRGDFLRTAISLLLLSLVAGIIVGFCTSFLFVHITKDGLTSYVLVVLFVATPMFIIGMWVATYTSWDVPDGVHPHVVMSLFTLVMASGIWSVVTIGEFTLFGLPVETSRTVLVLLIAIGLVARAYRVVAAHRWEDGQGHTDGRGTEGA